MIGRMRSVGIGEARQYLSVLIDEVQAGREVVITDRGRPVARLVPPYAMATLPFPDLSAFRQRLPIVSPTVSASVIEERGGRP